MHTRSHWLALRCVALAGFAHKLITIFRVRACACCIVLAYLAGGPLDGGDSGGGGGVGICEWKLFFQIESQRIHRHTYWINMLEDDQNFVLRSIFQFQKVRIRLENRSTLALLYLVLSFTPAHTLCFYFLFQFFSSVHRTSVFGTFFPSCSVAIGRITTMLSKIKQRLEKSTCLSYCCAYF